MRGFLFHNIDCLKPLLLDALDRSCIPGQTVFIAERALKCLVYDMKKDIRKLKKKEREAKAFLEDYIDLDEFYLLCVLVTDDWTVLADRNNLRIHFEDWIKRYAR